MAQRSTAARPAPTAPDIPPSTTRRLASLETAARYMDVTGPASVRRYITAGKLTGYRMGARFIRVDLDEVDQMLEPIPVPGGGTTHVS